MKETLYDLTAQMRDIEDALEESGGELTPELESLWDETAESLQAKADDYNALILKFGNVSEILGAEIARLQGLKKTADNGLKRLKAHLKYAMEANGIQRLEGTYCKMSLSSSTSTEIDEETLLMPYLHRVDNLGLPEWITVEFKISKKALKDKYKDAEYMPAGVRFVKSTQLRIK